MAVVRLGRNGEMEVLVPPTPEEVVKAKAALVRVAKALGRLAEEREWAERHETSAPGQQLRNEESADGLA